VRVAVATRDRVFAPFGLVAAVTKVVAAAVLPATVAIAAADFRLVLIVEIDLR
jgi:hypothetical protein